MNKNTFRIAFSLLAALLIIGSIDALASDQKAVEAAYTDWRNALGSGSAEAIVKLYDDGGILLATFEPEPLVGLKRIRPYFEGLTTLPKLSVKPQISNIRIHGSTAVNSGTYEFSYEKDGKLVTVPARFSFTYIKDGSGWKIIDHHSSVLPTK